MAWQHISSNASQSHQPSIGFTETERPGSEDPANEALVIHLYVSGATAVDANVRGREKIGY